MSLSRCSLILFFRQCCARNIDYGRKRRTECHTECAIQCHFITLSLTQWHNESVEVFSYFHRFCRTRRTQCHTECAIQSHFITLSLTQGHNESVKVFSLFLRQCCGTLPHGVCCKKNQQQGLTFHFLPVIVTVRKQGTFPLNIEYIKVTRL